MCLCHCGTSLFQDYLHLIGNWQKSLERETRKPAFNSTLTTYLASTTPASSWPVFPKPLVIPARGRKCRQRGHLRSPASMLMPLRAGFPSFPPHSLPNGGPPLPCFRTEVAAEEKGHRLPVGRCPCGSVFSVDFPNYLMKPLRYPLPPLCLLHIFLETCRAPSVGRRLGAH